MSLLSLLCNKMLQCGDMIHKKLNRQYVLSTQGKFTDGFAKQTDTHLGTASLPVDPYHYE